jgi:hypothetical protein
MNHALELKMAAGFNLNAGMHLEASQNIIGSIIFPGVIQGEKVRIILLQGRFLLKGLYPVM